MAYDGWLDVNGTELANLSRTVQLSNVLGVDSVWLTADSVEWIETALGGTDYDDVTEAPWYDPSYPASGEFAGVIPLSMAGMGNSTRESNVVEYITDGGRTTGARNATLPIVASMVLVASSDQGAEYGKRWLDRLLRQRGQTCGGFTLSYFQFVPQEGDDAPPIWHYRNVSLTRAISVTRRFSNDCSTLWWITFTLTAGDPYEYGEEIPAVTTLGGLAPATGPLVDSSGSTVLVEEGCPSFDYSPIYDPFYPALVTPPAPPNFYPDGWDIFPGMTFDRFWARLDPIGPTLLGLVPQITLTADSDARMVRVSIWSSDDAATAQCGALFSAVVAYMPPALQFIIDGEQQASYAWDGLSPVVRRTDSLVFSPDAAPVDWTSFNDPGGLMVTLDVFSDSDSPGSDSVQAAVAFVPKSD